MYYCIKKVLICKLVVEGNCCVPFKGRVRYTTYHMAKKSQDHIFKVCAYKTFYRVA